MKNDPEIIAENEWLIAINKPAGLITHSDGRTEEPSLAEWLVEHVPGQRGKGESWISPQGEYVDVAGLVHRLDRTTSGILLAAKTNESFAYLKNEFRERHVEKSYRAWVYGALESDHGTIVAEIVRTGGVPKRWGARECEASDLRACSARAAVTMWKRLRILQENGQYLSEVEARPLTGRTHQIRVHFAHLGHPLVSDHLYAPDRRQSLGFSRPALHAHTISLTLPSGEHVVYEAPLSQDFVDSVNHK